jgi:hypothetical protein
MARNPAVLFYTDDFLAGTYTMTYEQKGQYITLLCLQHQQGHLTEKHMLSICKTHDPDIWCKFLKDDDGLFYNRRMEEETQKRNAYCDNRRSNKLSKPKEKQTHEGTYVDTHVEHMSLHMGNGNSNIFNTKISKQDIDNFFESIWNLYPNKKGKGQVSAAKKAMLHKVGFEQIQSAVSRYLADLKKDDWRKPQNGSTFFNSGYVDYLDANYATDEPKPDAPLKSHIEIINGEEVTVWD